MGELDCNGLSQTQKPVKNTIQCIDPRGSWNDRFYDNGHYIGHDEPSIRFVSSQPGSGDNVTYNERLPVEPRALPTVQNPGHDVTHTFELTIAPWFSIDVCDPDSTPMLPCTPESDANAPSSSSPGGRRRLRRAAVLPARVRAVLRQHQLRQHALVLGAHDRQRGVRRHSGSAPDRVARTAPSR